jgi:hypothetical protein
MRVLVCGGRAYTDRDELYAELDAFTPSMSSRRSLPAVLVASMRSPLNGRRHTASRRKRSERNGERLAAQGERVRFAMRAYWRKADQIS